LAIFAPMTDRELARQLRQLSRIALMLASELRHGHLDEELIEEIDRRMEQGIAADPRGAALRPVVDALRESTMTPRPELMGDTIRACERLRDAIDALVGRLH
jgi:hypothetical protein